MDRLFEKAIDSGMNVQTAVLVWFAWVFEQRLSVIETALITVLQGG